jgi:hypothetical protein
MAVVALVVPLPPAVLERWYSGGFYPVLQRALTTTSNLVPFAWLDALLLSAALALVIAVVRTWRDGSRSRWRRVASLLGGLLEAAAIAYLVFLACWGLNYRRVPAAERFEMDRARLTPAHLRVLVQQAVEQVNATYANERRHEDLTLRHLTRTLAPAFQAARARAGDRWRIVPGRPKASLVARSFRLSSVDGLLNPFGLEVVLNPEVLPFERPFVLAHEWAHLGGHADESEASFVAWLACLEGDRAAQYSGWLAVLLHAVRGLPREEQQPALAELEAGPRADIAALQQRFRRSHPVARRVSWQVYEQYLRANRVEGGLASYDEVVQLVLGSRVAAPLLDRPGSSDTLGTR